MGKQIHTHNLALPNRAMDLGTMNQGMITNHQPSRYMDNNSLRALILGFTLIKEAQPLSLAMPSSNLTASLVLIAEAHNNLMANLRGQLHHMDLLDLLNNHNRMTRVHHRCSLHLFIIRPMGHHRELLMDTISHLWLVTLSQAAKLHLDMAKLGSLLMLSLAHNLLVMVSTNPHNPVTVNNHHLTM